MEKWIDVVPSQSKSSEEVSMQPVLIPAADTAFRAIDLWDEGIQEVNIVRREKNILHATTVKLAESYKRCNPSFKPIEILPQRTLTNPSEGVLNNGYDNEESNLICRVHDPLVSPDKTYIILDLLGTGTFGQVFRCKREGTKDLFAVKVIKNKPAYHTQGSLEIKIAKLLNQQYDPHNEKHIVRLLESFHYRGHICLVFELLSMSLLDLLTQNQFRGLPLSLIQRFTKQILTALIVLEDANIIHCDLKPENILLVPSPQKTILRKHPKRETKEGNEQAGGASTGSPANEPHKTIEKKPTSSGGSDIKVIDLGSACFEGRTIYSYIQSRFYRSPEVLLGSAYTGAIDMWSLACVCAEMYLGLPLFPGVSQHNQLSRIVEMFGVPPDFLLESKNGLKYFTPIRNPQEKSSGSAVNSSSNLPGLASADGMVRSNASSTEPNNINHAHIPSKSSNPFLPTNSSAISKYRIKTAEEYAAETNTEAPVLKKYLRYSQLEDVVMKCPFSQKAKLSNEQKQLELLKRKSFLDFLLGLFKLNPFERWTAKQAIQHPFIQNTPFAAPYIPKPDLKLQERKLMFMVQLQQRSHQSSQHYHEEKSVLKGLRVPTNFSSNTGLHESGETNFTPLQLSHRRLSEPTEALGSHHKKEHSNREQIKETAAPNDKATNSDDSLSRSDRPMLKRGDPVHGKKSAAPTSAESVNGDSDKAKEKDGNDHESKAEVSASHTESHVKASPENTATAAVLASSPSGTIASNVSANTSRTNKTVAGKAKPASRHSFTNKNMNNNHNHNHTQGTGISPGMGWQQPSYNNGVPFYPPPWSIPAPHMMPPNMIPQALPFFPTVVDGNGNIVNPMLPPPIPMPMDLNNPNSYYQPNTPGASSSANMASSFGASSYTTMFHPASGSMQEGNVLADFGMALLRPEMDEQRLLLSQNSNMMPYWRPVAGSYMPYHGETQSLHYPPGAMMQPLPPYPPNFPNQINPQMGNYAYMQPPMQPYHVVGSMNNPQNAARSFESKMNGQGANNSSNSNQNNKRDGNRRRNSRTDNKNNDASMQGGSSSYTEKAAFQTYGSQDEQEDEAAIRSSLDHANAPEEPLSPTRGAADGKDEDEEATALNRKSMEGTVDALAAWDPFFESAD